jgi:GTPase SAR1 family protein
MSSSLEAKIVVLGAQNVGKTSLVMRYCKGAFNPSQVTSTVGASFLTKRVVDNDSDTVVRLQIWDTGMCICCFGLLCASFPSRLCLACSRFGS